MSDSSAITDRVADYYSNKLREHGPTPRGVDWNGEASQLLRFGQLSGLLPTDESATLLDFGCGYGAFSHYLSECRPLVSYSGVDISAAMIQAASKLYPDKVWLSETSSLGRHSFDFVIASGIFSVKLEFEPDRWHQHILDTLAEMDRLSRRGFAFNCLTSYSDEEHKREDLYYPEPEELFRTCKRDYARNVALLHDYDLYEFTILVRKT